MRRSTKIYISALLIAATTLSASEIFSADWPTWRHDSSRGGVTQESLAEKLVQQWNLQLPTPRGAWPENQERIQFDASYEPIVTGQTLVVASMVRDNVTAYDTRTGGQRWRFYANGPIRFAPLAHQGKLYFVSDDGYLYCLRVADGLLVWKFRGGPSDRKLIGNDRLISMWPARGAPAMYDGVVYFTAGIWPFMGIFIHAVDAETGEVVWTNSGSGSNYLVQPHNSPAFAGVSPQGYLAINEDVLIVPGGRSVPAGYDRKSGDFLYFHIGSFKRNGGGYKVIVGRQWFAQAGILCSSRNGELLGGDFTGQGDMVTASDDLILQRKGDNLTALNGRPTIENVEIRDRKGKVVFREQINFKKIWRTTLPKEAKIIYLQAGNRIYASDGNHAVLAIDLPEGDSDQAKLSWSGRIRGAVWNMLVADQRLFVVSKEGEITCFGADQRETLTNSPSTSATSPSAVGPKNDPKILAGLILQKTGHTSGYCLVLGLGDASFVEQLARQSDLHVIVMDSDSGRVSTARRRWANCGLLGERISVIQSDPATALPPPYMANLIVCSDLQSAGFGPDGSSAIEQFVDRMYDILRPYGGAAVLVGSNDQHSVAKKILVRQKPHGATLERIGDLSLIRRTGALADSAPWTHHNADVGNSLISQDKRVKTPLGLLWFGGPSNQEVLPRHGHGPTPQVVGGRLFIEGPDMLRAVDVYTGRLLWQRELKELGLYYNNTGHHPGAGAVGGNYVSLIDGIYVAFGHECLRLDPATGKTISTFTLPPGGNGESSIWGYIGVHEDVLIAGSSPMLPFSKSRSGDKQDTLLARYGEGSKWIVALDRHSGKVLWRREANTNFRHNAIVAGDGKLFCLDRMTAARLSFLKRRGQAADALPMLYALDIRTGEIVWKHEENVFGTWLGFSAKHHLLLQTGSLNRDRSKDETGQGMTVYRAETGKTLWHSDDHYTGPPLIHDEQIITQGSALSLLTGQRITRKHPLTGAVSNWNFTRNYGCNTAIGCTHLLTFRSASAGYFDLTGDGGTGNFGGFRSSCTSNLVPADGVLNAPDYTRTCSCSYQLQCSLALTYMPDVEMWTFNSQAWDNNRVERVGINFGAPGDRRDAHGTLWLDYPSVGGNSPDLPLEVRGENIQYFRHHSSLANVQSGNSASPAWVSSSGVYGVETISITLSGKDDTSSQKYTVRLHFADYGRDAPTSSVFDILLQGKIMERNLVVAESSKGNNGHVMREFMHVEVNNQLEIAMHSIEGRTVVNGVEIILER